MNFQCLRVGAVAWAGLATLVLSPTQDEDPIPARAPSGGALVLIFVSAECPISNAYSTTLNDLSEAFPPDRFRLIGLCTDPDLSSAALDRHAAEYRLRFPVHLDVDLRVARRLGIRVIPEAVVLDDAGRVRYRGRIDDQFAARRRRRANPRTRELYEAIAAVLDGREVADPVVPAVGCPLPEPPQYRPAPALDSEQDTSPRALTTR